MKINERFDIIKKSVNRMWLLIYGAGLDMDEGLYDALLESIEDIETELKLTQDENVELDSDMQNLIKELYGSDATVSISEIANSLEIVFNDYENLRLENIALRAKLNIF